MYNEDKGAVALLAVGHFPVKGGDADGRRALGESLSLPIVPDHHLLGVSILIPKSVLTARLPPERSTNSLNDLRG